MNPGRVDADPVATIEDDAIRHEWGRQHRNDSVLAGEDRDPRGLGTRGAGRRNEPELGLVPRHAAQCSGRSGFIEQPLEFRPGQASPVHHRTAADRHQPAGATLAQARGAGPDHVGCRPPPEGGVSTVRSAPSSTPALARRASSALAPAGWHSRRRPFLLGNRPPRACGSSRSRWSPGAVAREGGRTPGASPRA